MSQWIYNRIYSECQRLEYNSGMLSFVSCDFQLLSIRSIERLEAEFVVYISSIIILTRVLGVIHIKTTSWLQAQLTNVSQH